MLDSFVEYVRLNDLGVCSVIVSKGGRKESRVLTEDSPKNIRSISKVVSCLGAGKAVEEGLIRLDDPVMDYMPPGVVTRPENVEHVQALKVENLLDLTIGQEDGLMFSKDVKNLPPDTDYLSYILNYPILHAPGTYFKYNNAATYLLCYIVQQVTGMRFVEWVQSRYFDEMGIEPPLWEETWQGVCLGASGLHLSNEDMHKVALLLLHEGAYDGKALVSPDWVKQMRSPHFMTESLPEYVEKQGRCINKMAYGFGLWVCGDATESHPKTHFFCDGTNGQLLVVDPARDLAVTITSDQKDMNPLYTALELILER